MVVLALALVGGVGAVARFALDGFVIRRGLIPGFPLGTLVVNLTGAFALGLLHGSDVGGDALTIVGTGLIGSYTTFSTWMLESERLGEDGEPLLLWANLAVSLVLGLAAYAIGVSL
jgi:CrcB protein